MTRRLRLRLHRIVAIACLGALWMLGVGCEQEAPPPKPAAPVVKKKIQAPEQKPAPQKPAGEEKAPSGQATAPTVKPEAPPPTETKAGLEKPTGVMAGTPPSSGAPPSLPEPPKPSQEVAAYQYQVGDRPDPFRPFFEEAKATGPVVECENVPPGPLTENEASQFSLVAVVGQGTEVLAMVQDRSGKGYVVRPGTHMGKKCGRVSVVGSEGVTVEEPYRDLLGQKKTRKVILGFKKSEGGKR